VAEGTSELGYAEFVSLGGGDRKLRDRLAGGESLRVQTPFNYPGRRGAVVLELVPATGAASGSRAVRITDAGGLIKSLDEQGLDVSIDMIVSKTVVHAVKEVEGAGVSSGEIYLDSTANAVAVDMWRFLQLVAELVGLRHAKYKDALLQLSRGPEGTPDLIGWEER
jgi:hypothetical protein